MEAEGRYTKAGNNDGVVASTVRGPGYTGAVLYVWACPGLAEGLAAVTHLVRSGCPRLSDDRVALMRALGAMCTRAWPGLVAGEGLLHGLKPAFGVSRIPGASAGS